LEGSGPKKDGILSSFLVLGVALYPLFLFDGSPAEPLCEGKNDETPFKYGDFKILGSGWVD
jgi:hypothetical protein